MGAADLARKAALRPAEFAKACAKFATRHRCDVALRVIVHVPSLVGVRSESTGECTPVRENIVPSWSLVTTPRCNSSRTGWRHNYAVILADRRGNPHYALVNVLDMFYGDLSPMKQAVS